MFSGRGGKFQCFVFAIRMIILFYLFTGCGAKGELPLGPPHLQALGLAAGRVMLSPWAPLQLAAAEQSARPRLQMKTCTYGFLFLGRGGEE